MNDAYEAAPEEQVISQRLDVLPASSVTLELRDAAAQCAWRALPVGRTSTC